jgi:hypothetical protein
VISLNISLYGNFLAGCSWKTDSPPFEKKLAATVVGRDFKLMYIKKFMKTTDLLRRKKKKTFHHYRISLKNALIKLSVNEV